MSAALTNIEFSFYADDLKLSNTISSSNDHFRLQQSLNQVASWGGRNGLKPNIGKCQVITLSSAWNVTLYDYSLDGRDLQRVEVVKNLGVFLDSKMRFSAHIDRTISKCLSLLGLIKRVA